MANSVKKILIIAGSDSGGGAGLQADIKTACAHKVFCSTIVTSLTAQNTQGVFAIHNPDINFLKKQLEVVLDDIKFDAVKIGMLSNLEIAQEVFRILKDNRNIKNIVLDPVMVATSGDALLEDLAIDVLKKKLLPISILVTPNIDEANILSGMEILNLEDMKLAAKKIKELGVKNVLIKGGHLNISKDKIYSILLDDFSNYHLIYNNKISKIQFHGTGCSLASAICSNLAKGNSIKKSVKKANKYVFKTLKSSLKVGKGSLVLNHFS